MDKRLGFIHDKYDIKVFILFILNRLSAPVSAEKLGEIVTDCDDGIGYFDFAECLADLRGTDHVIEHNGEYSITDKGRENGKITESGLPYSTRIKAERLASALSLDQRRKSMITATHSTRSSGGYKVSLNMSDGIGPVMSIELFASDENQASIMENNFRCEAEAIYGRIIESLTK